MRRLAELPPLRYLAIACVLGGVYLVLRWIDRDDPADAATAELHVRLRPGHVLGPTPGRAAPLFTHRVAADDVRARWWRLDVPASRAAAELARLAADPDVDEAFVAPALSLPSAPSAGRAHDDACPITTPSYQELQGYLGPAPEGVDAPAAWRAGTRGEGVWFADIEGGWNPRHEDLPDARIAHVHGTPITEPGWSAHGTAVLGEVVGIDNGRGVTGIAPDVERVLTSSIGSSDAADAIDSAAGALRPGDVLLVELQGYGPRGRFVPVEYWDDIFDAIHAATARGIVVVEAAGNGG